MKANWKRLALVSATLLAGTTMMIAPTMSQAAPKHLVTAFFTSVYVKADGDAGRAGCGEFLPIQVRREASDLFKNLVLGVPKSDKLGDETDVLCSGDKVPLKILDMSNTLQFQAAPGEKLGIDGLTFELDSPDDLESALVGSGSSTAKVPAPNTWQPFSIHVVDDPVKPALDLTLYGAVQTSQVPVASNAKKAR